MEFNSTMNFKQRTCSFLSTLSSDPLFSIIVTLYTLILLYFPRLFLGILFSPVLILTAILFLTFPRLGLIQTAEKKFNSTQSHQTHNSSSSPDKDRKWVSPKHDPQSKPEMGPGSDFDSDPYPFYADSFVEWNVSAPLEVIYEGEDEGGGEKGVMGMEKYGSLALYYPESETDSSSEGDFPSIGGWESPESMGFRWEEEGGDGLIEIALDGKRKSEDVFQVEEENMIEIDISPARNDELRRVFGSVNLD